MMRVDLRIHPGIREQVRAGLAALLVQGIQVWGPLSRDEAAGADAFDAPQVVKAMLGEVLFNTIRTISSLGFDPIECLGLAVGEKERETRHVAI